MDVMVDLETMSSDSHAAIVSIGAVAFDPTGPITRLDIYKTSVFTFYENVSLASSMEYGLEVSPETIMWWLKQSQEARDALINPPPSTLDTALRLFSTWFGRVGAANIWAHGGFDLPILSYAYKKTKIAQPFKYTKQRDVRTLKDRAFPGEYIISGVDYHTGAHNALWDAWRQACEIQACEAKLG